MFEKYLMTVNHYSVDEMIPDFRGHCSFKIYMPSKPENMAQKQGLEKT